MNAARFRSVFTCLRACVLLAAAAPILTAPTLGAQSGPAVATLLRQAEVAPVLQVYEYANQIVDLAPDSNLDGFRDQVLGAVAPGSSAETAKGRLAAALALRSLKNDSTYGKDVLDLLTPVANSADDGVRAATMAVLGDDRLFNNRVLPDVRKIVLENCKDELVAPSVRIEAALALWQVGTNEDRATAKATLEQFLQSTDRELRQRGALALAELNIEGGPAWTVLREIRDEPTDAGRRARLFLRREEERRQLEQSLARIVERNTGTGSEHDDYRILTELRQRVRAQHLRGSTVTDQELVEYAAKGMLEGLDPHSTFFTSDEYKRFFFDLNREYGGIGAFVNFDQDNDFSIVRPIYSGPAYEIGLRSGDKILEVDGWETAGHTSDEIVTRLKGRPETPVVLKVFRAGFQEPQVLTVLRRQISVPAVNWTMVPGEIGYVELISFSSNLAEELRRALADVTAKGARGIVLDVRNNTGGFLSQAGDVVEQFLDGKKLVVYTEGPAEPRRDYYTEDGPRAVCKLPLAVLTNNFSASASEITAGALQDHGRATIIGQRSFGKGSVQNLFALRSDPPEAWDDLNGDGNWQEGEPFTDRNQNGKYDYGAHIKLTVAKYHLPSGRCPHREFDKEGRIVDPNWGVMPDKVVDLLENKPEDAWKNAAVFALLKKAVFRDYVKSHMAEHEALFRQLAEGDEGDPKKYPGFDEFYRGLDTKLTEDDVRRWLRYEVRDQISDLRGAVYPGQRALGDPQEDAQLQEAVRTLLQQDGRDIRELAAYHNVLKIKFPEEPRTSAK
ncbi:MAG: PDZ domain-containing protein [Planctomycetes bacterium]|nr:PDZ domain-containing protein [Planctomycetota bacterium]